MKKRWLLFVIPVILSVCALGLTRSMALRIRLMPRTVLRNAINEAVQDLTTRFEDNPVVHIASVFELQDQQIRLQSESDGAKGDAFIQLSPRRVTGSLSGPTLSAEFYADADALAFSSQQLTGGKWLGITYERFMEDIAQIPLIRWILTESMLQSWEHELAELRSGILAEFSVPPLPQITREELAKLHLALAAMKTEVSRTTIQTNQGAKECFRILCEASGKAWHQVLENGTEVTCAFYLQETSLIAAQISIRTNDNQTQLHLGSEGSWAEAPVVVSYSCREGEQAEVWSARVDSDYADGILSEHWDLTLNGRQHDISYRWEISSGNGAFLLSEDESVPFRLTLHPQGFHLETENGAALAKAFSIESPIPLAEHWEIDVQPGTAPAVPDYRTPDTWTTDDLLTILEGLGDTLKLPFP